MNKLALVNITFNPNDASNMKQYVANMEKHGYRLEFEPTFRTIADEDRLIELLKGKSVFIGSGAPFTKRVLDACPQLRIISRTGVGYETIDIDAASSQKIAVLITPGVGAEAVSEFAFALMLAAGRRVVESDRAVRAGNWDRMVGVAMWHKTLGIIGLGRIGKKLVEISKGFDMKVLAFDEIRDDAFAKKNNVTYCESLGDLLRESDYISIHTNLTEKTRNLIGLEQLQKMKPTAVIVSAARGGIINENDLFIALKSKTIAAAGLDVFVDEPVKPDNPLLTLDNLVASAHNAGSSAEGKNKLIEMAFQNVLDIDAGLTPVGLLNPDAMPR
jgi:phosphoglycerate dehydrogenase-like enzyme